MQADFLNLDIKGDFFVIFAWTKNIIIYDTSIHLLLKWLFIYM